MNKFFSLLFKTYKNRKFQRIGSITHAHRISRLEKSLSLNFLFCLLRSHCLSSSLLYNFTTLRHRSVPVFFEHKSIASRKRIQKKASFASRLNRGSTQRTRFLHLINLYRPSSFRFSISLSKSLDLFIWCYWWVWV